MAPTQTPAHTAANPQPSAFPGTASLTMPSPLGTLTLHATDHAVIGLEIGHASDTGSTPSHASTPHNLAHPVLAAAKAQLEEYFAGTRHTFDVPVSMKGTPFQEAVWSALESIPYGETASYGQLAQRVGRPGAARAVGGAVGGNPVPIIVPCHRVMGSTGKITGYSGGDGIATKKALLAHENTR
ncbi:methylated-DNA--[protein]-cysteine S-methyltransferase [Pontimonas sp.]|uniref:methylated-DNA--[protein]-cysteine S-methyltransferase n=1 Tax=Pontimonas sp. TaxID=2304492 RepID=UPI00287054D5|nr:methylated-DNA--[protein]-cysteine S-methyltransferase [Pontimonas sp.]MDR9396933.1 methylated-DNA--[protein]-cysteine S-methyltransferase [Pontimonas sp.]MDR9434339.1 methylated-DNA--[protein]-cysteine S-methyltransferase [Pontimonas sp.]